MSSNVVWAAVALGLFVACAGSASAAASDLRIWVDVDGTAYLENTTDTPISFDGYQIASEAKNLDPAGWDSINDRVPERVSELIAALGAGALTFGEANPGDSNLAELNLGGVGTLPGKARLSLGKPFISLAVACEQDSFFWSAPGTGSGDDRPAISCAVPEPSAWLLAALAGLGILAMRWRTSIPSMLWGEGLGGHVRRAAIALGLLASLAGSANAHPCDLQLWVDVDGTAYLVNTTDGPVSFDGYQIASEGQNLDPAGWDSISDRIPERITELIGALGAGTLTFGEANPGDANLAELNLGGVATLAAHARFSLGKPFKTFSVSGADAFFWSGPGSGGGVGGTVCIPEPSTWLLAALAGLGHLAFRRRR